MEIVRVKELATDDYRIAYDPDTGTVKCSGTLRLAGMEDYEPIAQLLDAAAAAHPSAFTLDLEQLEYLNSSGINMLSKFAIRLRQKGTVTMTLRGTKRIPWQTKSLKNLQRLLPSLSLVLD